MSWMLAATAAVVLFAGAGSGSAARAGTSYKAGLVKNPVTSNISFLSVGSVGTGAGFEDNDGDLASNQSPPLTDWNSFTPTWTGSAPYQIGSGSANGFTFSGATDDAATTSDSGFAGGVKQDTVCPAVIGSKAQNKDDLARIYLAGTIGSNGDTYLMLSWVRIPQNTTSADAHVAFEFNQGTTACSGTNPLVQRTAGDLLVIYDFTNGGTPTISIERWITSGSCQVGSDSPPCWGTEQQLGSGVAEAAVNTGDVTDTALPGGGPATLGTNEFGEAGIDLTQAVFNLSGNRTCERFGSSYAVSRSSGSSSDAQMEDLVGPLPINLSNCASPTITTQASPTSHLTLGQQTTVGDTATFHNGNNPTGNVTFTLYSDSSCTQSTGVTGTGSISSNSASYSTSWTPTAAGTYHWKASYPGDGNNNSVTTGCGDANEQIVVDKASPSLTTQASPTTHLPILTASTVGDTATFHNAYNPTGTVSFTLYSNNTCTQSTGVSGAGSISSGTASYSSQFTPSAAGTYYWQASYNGDANNNSFTTGCTDANEQLTVDQASPSITTQASPTSHLTVGTGATVGDSATFQNAASPTGSVTFTLYSDNTCKTSTGVSGSGSISGGSASYSSSFTPQAVGTYYWQASYAGDANNKSFTTGCTDANEQISADKASPSITTQASPTSGLTVGTAATVGDTATFHNAYNPTGNVTFTLYTDNTCSTSTGVSGTGAVSSGTASYSHSFTPSDATTYYWRASYAGDANNNGFTTGCTDTNEQVSAGKASPTITTQASPASHLTAGTGATVGDTATFHDAVGPTGSVTFTLYSDNTCQTSTGVIGSGTISGGSASFSSSFTPPAAGTYYWQASYTGDAKNNGFTTGCTDANEQLVADKASPTITTQAGTTGPLTVGVAGTVSDSAAFHNAVSPTGNVTFTLYTDNTCGTSTGVGGDGAISSGSASFSHAFTAPAAGTYYWRAHYAGDANNNAFTTGCTDANEQISVGKASPSITTQASPTSPMTVGSAATVGDTATLHDAFSPTGSVTFTLYSDDQCAHSTGVTGSGTISSGSASYSASFTPSSAATYYWKAHYDGDANNNGFTTTCGDANEQISAGKTLPTITTQASPTSHLTVGTGATVGDTATLHGAVGPTGSITFTLYSDDTCQTSTGVTGSGTISNGSASFSSSFTPQAAGTYYWKAHYDGDADNSGFTTSCGDDNEQIVADRASPSITTQASPTDPLTAGTAGTVGDTATFHNAFDPTGNVTFTLYSDNTCQTSTGIGGDGAISNGSASFSHSFTPATVGTYYWKAHYAGDANNSAFTTGCADDNEQISVQKTSPSIATTLSATDGAVGDTVHDSAQLTGATPDAGGHVTYTVYTDDQCSLGARDAGTVDVTGGSVPDSNGLQFNAAGTYYWQASYTGDGNNGAATSPCKSEILSIGKNAPTITTSLSATDGAIGDSIHDGSTLHNATADASGTATYRVYTDDSCQNLAVAGTDIDGQPAAVSVSGGDVADSPAVQFLRAGDYYWQVTYSGDANNVGATSPCNSEDNEHVAIAKNEPSISTQLSASVITAGSSVHDTANLSGATADAGGTVTYSVYDNNECTGDPVDAGTVDVDSGQVPNSNGVAFPNIGTYYWQASYSGDANNTAATSSCTDEPLKIASITILKNPKSQAITAGGTATFTITVTNNGTADLTNVTVDDLLAPNCAKAIGDLAAGQSTSYDCTLSAVSASFTNSATATGHYSEEGTVQATDKAPVTVNQVPPPPPPPPPPPKIDLAITKVGTPNPTTVHKNITWTMVVTNNGPNNATGVTVADPIPGGTTYVSSATTQGTCTGGAVLSCQIGNMSAGQTVTVTLVTTANQTGTIPNTATVVGNEAETNTANNTASASVNVVGVFKPPVVYCTAAAVSPQQLFVGRTNKLRIKLTQHGKPAAGVHVKIKGSTIYLVTGPSNKQGLVTRAVKPMKAGIVTFTPIASKRCNAPRVGVIGVFTPPVTG